MILQCDVYSSVINNTFEIASYISLLAKQNSSTAIKELVSVTLINSGCEVQVEIHLVRQTMSPRFAGVQKTGRNHGQDHRQPAEKQ